MNNNKFSSLTKAIFEQTDLPDNAVSADLGCRDAGFLLGFQEAFPSKIKSAVGIDITDKGSKNVKYKKPIKLKVMDCRKKLKFDNNTFDFVFAKDMFECVLDKELLVLYFLLIRKVSFLLPYLTLLFLCFLILLKCLRMQKGNETNGKKIRKTITVRYNIYYCLCYMDNTYTDN